VAPISYVNVERSRRNCRPLYWYRFKRRAGAVRVRYPPHTPAPPQVICNPPANARACLHSQIAAGRHLSAVYRNEPWVTTGPFRKTLRLPQASRLESTRRQSLARVGRRRISSAGIAGLPHVVVDRHRLGRSRDSDQKNPGEPQGIHRKKPGRLKPEPNYTITLAPPGKEPPVARAVRPGVFISTNAPPTNRAIYCRPYCSSRSRDLRRGHRGHRVGQQNRS